MLDIKKFLMERLSNQESPQSAGQAPVSQESEDSDWTDESEDTEDTLEDNRERAEVSVGNNRKENIPPPVKTATKHQELLTFSPPEKLPANPPSHLIWNIFGRENQARKESQKQQQKLKTKSKSSSDIQRRKSAPLSVKFDPNTNNSRASARSGPEETEAEENVSYNSTLLRMRVVELEQEIETFKQENKKVMILKKKLQTEKDNLAKDLSSFEDVKTAERKKIEEEKRRIKRDQSLLEKRSKAQTQEKCKKCEEFKIEKNKLDQQLKSKESKFTEEITKLKNQLKLVKSDNQDLQNEMQRMKNRNASSKIALTETETSDQTIEVTNHSRDHSGAPTSEGRKSGKPKDGNVEIKEVVFEDGHKEVWFSNGNRKEVSRDGKMVKIFYYNGDVKESWSDGTEKYLYGESQTWHTNLPDGTVRIQFSNGQTETRAVTGETTIAFPDGTKKTIAVTGEERIAFPDGTKVTVFSDGTRRLEMPNGLKYF